MIREHASEASAPGSASPRGTSRREAPGDPASRGGAPTGFAGRGGAARPGTNDLEAFAASDAPLPERVAVAREIARAVEALHARGRVHGALHPAGVMVLESGGVVIPPATEGEDREPLARAGFDAPEVARGAPPSRRSDAFAAGALAYLVLARVPPFEAPDPLERIRRVLFVDAPPLRLRAPDVPVEIEAEIAAVLERRPRRRHGLGDLIRALEAADPRPSTTSSASATTNASRGTGRRVRAGTFRVREKCLARPSKRPATSTPTETATATANSAPAPTAPSRICRALSASPASPLRRAGLVALPVVSLALLYMPSGDGGLAGGVAAAIERGDHASARRLLDDASRARPGDPFVEKLRGDLACARRASGECLRRYRVALAARPELRDDASLRLNVRRMLGREHGCAARRAAANLLGEIRDPEALPALEEARRSGGLLAFLCTGDSFDRAMAATRASTAGPTGAPAVASQ